MTNKLAIPGNLAIENHDYDPLYTIILPKEKFLEYFEKTKGIWPEGKTQDETYKQFGYNLPEKEKGIILPKSNFIERNNLIGVKILGEYYDYHLKRELNFEILNLPRAIFEPKDLKTIIHVRELSFLEARCNPRDSIIELKWLEKYFSGKYQGKSTEEIRDSLSHGEKNLIDLLRDCKISEEILE